MSQDEINIPPENQFILKVELDTTPCCLRNEEPALAIDYICQKFPDYEAVLPICQDCLDKLHSDDWVLLYCTFCCSNIWIYKPDSLKRYHYAEGEHIKWMGMCPHCAYKSGEEE